MQPATLAQLLSLNRRFYAAFGPAFAATRRRIQNGVRRVLAELPDEGAWLDLGCGSGALAVEWLRAERQSAYLGVDFSPSLLAEAQAALAAELDSAPASISFAPADLSRPGWADALAGQAPFRGVLAFAVLHHLPGVELRRQVLRQVAQLLQPAGVFVHSEWQFQHSPKLMERRVPWAQVGLAEADLEPGDTLLDWRYNLPGQPEQVGLRYVHLFTRAELADLAAATGFRIVDAFESDGQGGRLSLYQVWERLSGQAP